MMSFFTEANTKQAEEENKYHNRKSYQGKSIAKKEKPKHPGAQDILWSSRMISWSTSWGFASQDTCTHMRQEGCSHLDS